MAATERFEYHLLAGRVVQRKVVRPQGKKRWHYRLHCPTLVATIEPLSASLSVHKGAAATDDLVVDALRYHLGLLVDANIPDIGPAVPSELAQELANHVGSAIRWALLQYRSFAQEEDITACLKGILEKAGFTHRGWEAAIRTWTYARRPKERDLGVDLGLIVDLLHGGFRVVKAMWFQAKRADRLPGSLLDLPDLPRQVALMQRHTREAYALVYSPTEIFAFHGDSPTEPLALESVVYDGILCRRGDRSPRVVALTADSRLVVEMLVTGQ